MSIQANLRQLDTAIFLKLFFLLLILVALTLLVVELRLMPMSQDELITHEDGNDEAWICLCGNRPSAEGFYPCDEKGNEMEPVNGWKGLYVCSRCGRIIEQDSLRVVGRRRHPIG
jgi:hypothetical protein